MFEKLPTLEMNKLKSAGDVIRTALSPSGVCASTDRYQHQCWTRDFCMAIYPFVKYTRNWGATVVEHFNQLCERQEASGKVAILYLNDERQFLRARIDKSIRQGKMSFMLERYLENEIHNLTPHTRDAEALFVIAAGDFLDSYDATPVLRAKLTSAIELALGYIERGLKDELIVGADWRDTRVDLDDKAVLTNACLLYQAYMTMKMEDKALRVKDIIQSRFWNGAFFDDYPGCHSFDILGNALAVLYDIADETQRETIFQTVLASSTPYGFPMQETFLPALNDEEDRILKQDKAVIWPWINGFMLQAMLEKGGLKWQAGAKQEFQKWSKLEGHFEWYSISTGKGYGSANQTWSASMFLSTHSSILKSEC